MSNSIKPARYRGSSLTVKAWINEKYPMIKEGRGATWPTPEAKALYAPDGYLNPRWCLTCMRAFDATRVRHAHRGIPADGFDEAVVHGGPESLYCSDSCSRRARDRRWRNHAVWLECAGCGTYFNDWWKNEPGVELAAGERTSMPRHSCVPPWTPGETRLYILLASPCLSDPARAAKIEARDSQERVDRKKASDHLRAGERTEKRAEERARERQDLIRLLLFIEGYRRARTDAERLRERTAYDGVSEESAQALVRVIPEAIQHLDTCAWRSWPKTNEPHSKGQRRLHRYARLYRLAAEGRLAGYLDEERIQQGRRAADEARLGGQR
jgi:hypothetical protein